MLRSAPWGVTSIMGQKTSNKNYGLKYVEELSARFGEKVALFGSNMSWVIYLRKELACSDLGLFGSIANHWTDKWTLNTKYNGRKEPVVMQFFSPSQFSSSTRFFHSNNRSAKSCHHGGIWTFDSSEKFANVSYVALIGHTYYWLRRKVVHC